MIGELVLVPAHLAVQAVGHGVNGGVHVFLDGGGMQGVAGQGFLQTARVCQVRQLRLRGRGQVAYRLGGVAGALSVCTAVSACESATAISTSRSQLQNPFSRRLTYSAALLTQYE